MSDNNKNTQQNNKKEQHIFGESIFRDFISPESDKYKPEKDRYHLYIAYGCPFAQKALIVRNIKGLENIIGLSVAHPTKQYTKPEDKEDKHVGWVFRKPTDEPLSNINGYGSISCEGCIEDTVNGTKTVRELYELVLPPGEKTVYSVPALWDKKTKTIVNNESTELVVMFNSGMQELASRPHIDLNPEDLQDKIHETEGFLHKELSSIIFKAGFAKAQKDYDDGVNQIFNSLDKLEDILSKNKYLLGDRLTLADVSLFVVLIRFDEAFHPGLKINKKYIADYPHLLRYTKDVYNVEGVASTVNMDHIKASFFTGFIDISPYAIIPAGTNFIEKLKNKE